LGISIRGYPQPNIYTWALVFEDIPSLVYRLGISIRGNPQPSIYTWALVFEDITA